MPTVTVLRVTTVMALSIAKAMVDRDRPALW